MRQITHNYSLAEQEPLSLVSVVHKKFSISFPMIKDRHLPLIGQQASSVLSGHGWQTHVWLDNTC